MTFTTMRLDDIDGLPAGGGGLWRPGAAYAGDARMREWAADDDDLASVRDDPSLR